MQNGEKTKKHELATKKGPCNVIVVVVPVNKAGAIPQWRDTVLYDAAGDNSPSQVDGL